MIDIHSPTWAVVSKVCEDRLASAREVTEAHGRSIEDTEYGRGIIQMARAILDLAKPKEAKNLPREIGSVQY